MVNEVIKAGYRVRGVVRSEEKAALLREVFHKRYGSESLETAIVEDQKQPGALNSAMQGPWLLSHCVLFTRGELSALQAVLASSMLLVK